MWKPGQLVTVHNKVYRVRNVFRVCNEICKRPAIVFKWRAGQVAMLNCIFKKKTLPNDCVLRRIHRKPKRI